MRLVEHHVQMSESRILHRVRHAEDLVLLNRHTAEGLFSFQLCGLEVETGLEPDSMIIDEANQAHGSACGLGRQPGEFVEGHLRQRVQD